MHFTGAQQKTLWTVCGIACCAYFVFINYSTSDFISRKPLQSEEKLIFFHLQGSQNNGIGNIIFEIFAALGVARTLNRIPVFHGANYTNLRQIVKLPEKFPNLLESFSIRYTDPGPYVNYKFPGCCRMSNMTDILAKYNDRAISTYILFAQTLGYWRNYKREEVLHLVKFSENHMKIAREEMVDPKLVAKKYNVCVHVRRGDFVKSPLMETGENFTMQATRYVLNEVRKMGKTDISIVFLGNDPKWERNVVEKANFDAPSIVTVFNKTWPTHIDWIFSQLYCDTVIQTAPFSTYGWWIAYLSRGQNVYYNKEFAKKKDFEKQFDVNDHFLPSWKKIELKNGTVKEIGNGK